MGHRFKNCQKPKNVKGKNAQANIMEHENFSSKVQDMNLFAIVSKCYSLWNATKLWVATEVTRHICANHSIFSTYMTMDHDGQLYMRKSSSFKVEEHRKIKLKSASGKEITLNDILNLPEICKNLVFGFLLSKNIFRSVFVLKNIFTKNDMFVGNCYPNEGLFKMNLMTVVTPLMNKITSSTCLSH